MGAALGAGRAARDEAGGVVLGGVHRDAREPERVRRHGRELLDAIERRLPDEPRKSGRIASLKARDRERQRLEIVPARATREGPDAGVQRVGLAEGSCGEAHDATSARAEESAIGKSISSAGSITSGGVSTNTSRWPPPVVVR